ncbi:hypothetical protein I2I11_03615 [Pontibacter sp. 172403-2]|uniref:hypothetical protein n=1 Tax=Pontibacter rufus TaxID=2791028 RepID=UPI0018B00D19|nr:hypothetical protein [Pontibacter sp. 172403-2]MBF9252372.1 hypothetical protein [Pontibacter sp. 172403-2]
MFQAIFGGIFFGYIGLSVQWVTLFVIDTVKGREPKSFKAIKNKYCGITADSIAYGVGNNIIGMAFVLAVVWLILRIEGSF